LKANFSSGCVPSFTKLSKLENLEEVHYVSDDGTDFEMDESNWEAFKAMPKLKNYTVSSSYNHETEFAPKYDFKHPHACGLERLTVDFKNDNDM